MATADNREARSRSWCLLLQEIGASYVLQKHPLRIEERSVERDAMAHYVYEPSVRAVERYECEVFQLVVERASIANPAFTSVFVAVVAYGPTGDVFNVSF